jgi:hypothetical protein
MKNFYTHIVQTESIILELEKLDLSEEEKLELAGLVDTSLHHTILDAILSELTEEDKKIFLQNLEKEDHDEVWKHLNDKVDGIEEKIKKAADALKEEMHEDLKEAHRLKKHNV